LSFILIAFSLFIIDFHRFIKSLNKTTRVSRSRRFIIIRKMFRSYIFCWLYQMVFQF